MISRILKTVFVGFVWLFLLFGAVQLLRSPNDINYYENRYANRMPALSAEGYLGGSFQDGVEAALSDQIFGAQRMKKWYNDFSSARLLRMLDRESAEHPDYFYRYNGVYLHDGRLLWQPFDREAFQITFDQTVEALNRSIAANPDLPFYFFFVESDAVLDFKTGVRIPVREEACAALQIPEERTAWFPIESYEDYATQFYRTDHHWNYSGSYHGYRLIHDLLGIDEPCLTPLREVALSRTLTGSKATSAGLTEMREYPAVYEFTYPDLGVEYGHEAEVLALPDEGSFSYAYFYGGDEGLVSFDTRRPERENILILGDSFDNAVLKLLASHYNRTYSVDMRMPESQSFCIGDFAREHDIDRVLIIASQVLFCGDFLVEG